jgi:hypothetical protein
LGPPRDPKREKGDGDDDGVSNRRKGETHFRGIGVVMLGSILMSKTRKKRSTRVEAEEKMTGFERAAFLSMRDTSRCRVHFP